jgi:serine/threonine-protein kinase RsbW
VSQQIIQTPPTASLLDDVVAVTVPADSAYLSVLRTATAGLAARLNFTLDEIEDLRIAVDEACAMLLVLTPSSGDLHCRFEIRPGELTVGISAQVRPDTRLPDPSSFAWRVLSGLTSHVSTTRSGDHLTINLIISRPA